MTTIAQRNRDTVARFLEATHSGDFDAIDTTVDAGIRTHGFPCHSPQSREEYKQFFRDFGAAFSNMKYQTLALVADDSHVAARFLVEVNHTGEYLGIAPTGKRVSFTGQAIYRLKDGLIAETWLQLDGLAFLGQIGAIKQVA
ncbi:MAG: ester cyclase [Pseudolabrys sp.]